MVEIYKTIDGFENYSVSNFGNVRNDKTSRIMKQCTKTHGYKALNLYNNKIRIQKYVHILVALAFIPNFDNKATVDHIDNDSSNNHINNIRWATQSEQSQNRDKPLNNQSGITGVCKHRNKWIAYYSLKGKKFHIGIYNTIEEATEARIKKVNEVYGAFCNKSQKIKDDLEELEKEFLALL